MPGPHLNLKSPPRMVIRFPTSAESCDPAEMAVVLPSFFEGGWLQPPTRIAMVIKRKAAPGSVLNARKTDKGTNRVIGPPSTPGSRSRDRDCGRLTDPADVGHPALFRVSRFPMPNNEESDENPDQRRYQQELAHETALLCFIQGVWDAPRGNVQL